MALILFFTVLAIVALGASFVVTLPAAGRGALVVLAFSLFGFGLVVGSSVVIDENEVGIVKTAFGYHVIVRIPPPRPSSPHKVVEESNFQRIVIQP